MVVETEKHGDVIVIHLNRPQVRNAIDRETADQLLDAARTLEKSKQLKAAVLCGRGGHFCAGADLKAIATGRGNRITIDGDGPLGPTRMSLSKPIIAAVEGYAVAGGLELALWCDLRIASSTAVFGVFNRRWGVPLVDGGTVRLPRLIGQSRAMDMVLTGRAVAAEEALQFGLVNRLCEPGEALNKAIELAQEIIAFPQRCMLSDRRSVVNQWGKSHDEAMLQETLLGRETVKSGESAQGTERFLNGAGRHGEFK